MCDQIVGYYSVIASCSLLSNLLYYRVRLKLIRTPIHDPSYMVDFLRMISPLFSVAFLYLLTPNTGRDNLFLPVFQKWASSELQII
jgi:hypothetical protein